MSAYVAQVWGPFHFTNRFFARVAKNRHRNGIELQAATEVAPGWFLGGWYSYELGIDFGVVIDLCCELPERAHCRKYLCCPSWDGTLKADSIRAAVKTLADAKRTDASGGMPVLVHCAHVR